MKDLYIIYVADPIVDIYIDVYNCYEDAVIRICNIAGIRSYYRLMTDQGELWKIDGCPDIHLAIYTLDNAY